MIGIDKKREVQKNAEGGKPAGRGDRAAGKQVFWKDHFVRSAGIQRLAGSAAGGAGRSRSSRRRGAAEKREKAPYDTCAKPDPCGALRRSGGGPACAGRAYFTVKHWKYGEKNCWKILRQFEMKRRFSAFYQKNGTLICAI